MTTTEPAQELHVAGTDAVRHKSSASVLGDWLRTEAALDPDRNFVQCASPWITLGDLDRLSDRVAAGLQELGVEAGDRVAVNLPNRIEYIAAIYAIAKAGAIQVPLNTYLRGEFLRHQLRQTSPSVYIGDAAALGMLAPVLDRVPPIESIVLVGEPAVDSPLTQVITYFQLEESTAELAPVEVRPSDVCAIVYTSGTTGPSKGCTITHGYYCNLINVFIDYGWYEPGDIVFGSNPLFHFSGQTWLVAAALAIRGSVVVEPSFSASRYMARIRETGATAAMGMGAMGHAIMAQPVDPDERDHSLRHVTFMPSTPALVDAFAKRFGIEPFAEVFGQSECWPAMLGDPRGPRRPGSMGTVTPGLRVMLVDDEDIEVPTGQPGEIVLRGEEPHRLFSGYWNDSEGTATAFRSLWHHTGDCAYADEDGYFWFVDRKKDSLRRRGENVSSLELEAAISLHPGIAAVAVHAVPSSLSEDEIKACLVVADGHKIEAGDLFDFFRKNLPYYAVPRYVEFIDALPANVNGRVQKFVLRGRGITEQTLDFEALGLTITRSDRRRSLCRRRGLPGRFHRPLPYSLRGRSPGGVRHVCAGVSPLPRTASSTAGRPGREHGGVGLADFPGSGDLASEPRAELRVRGEFRADHLHGGEPPGRLGQENLAHATGQPPLYTCPHRRASDVMVGGRRRGGRRPWGRSPPRRPRPALRPRARRAGAARQCGRRDGSPTPRQADGPGRNSRQRTGPWPGHP
jgi:crotonobetaine/carnitine-CoA ligase